MAALFGGSGRVYGDPLLIEDCEDTWDEADPVAGVAISTTTGKTGNAARATTTTVGATTLLMSEVISKDLTTYHAAMGWIRSSVNTSSGDLHLQLDDTAVCASPLEDLSIPALTAATWRLVSLRFADPSLLGSLISVGLYQNTDLADGTFDIDDVYAVKEIGGIKNWSIDFTYDALDTTDFQDDGVAAFIPGKTQWSGSFDGDKDGAPLSIGSIVYMSFAENKSTNTQTFNGQVIITGLTPNTVSDTQVTYSYTFQGTGVLAIPTA